MRKIFAIISLLLVLVTLFACGNKSSDLNTNVPTYESTAQYAKYGNLTLSEKELYTLMRQSGYETMLDELSKLAINPSDYNLTKDDQKVTDLINKACYGTTDLTTLNSQTKETYLNKFVDQAALQGLEATKDNIYTDSVREYYLQQAAFQAYAKAQIENEKSKYYYKNEYQLNETGENILDSDGNKVSNPYYINMKKGGNLESYFNNTFQPENTTRRVIILGFATINDAAYYFDNKVDLYGNLNVTDNEALEAFEQAAKKMYDYDNLEDAILILGQDDYNKYNSTLRNLIDNLEDGEYFNKLQQVSSTKYLVYMVEKAEEKEFADLTNDELTMLTNKYIETLVTDSVTTSMINDLLASENTKIYDSLLSKLHKEENDSFVELKASEWKDEYKNIVASVNGKNLTVEKFYQALEKLYGPVYALNYFEQKLLLEKYGNLITEDDEKEFENTINTTLESFKNGDLSGYPTSLTEDEFNYVYYGANSASEVKEQLRVEKIFTYLQSKYDNVDNIVSTVETFGKQYRDKYFNLKIVHILISVDYNMDGSLDDPEIFRETLSDTQKAAFDDALLALSNAVLAEADYIINNKKYLEQKEALVKIAARYAAGDALLSDPAKTWNDYKKFNMALKVEDLGAVSTSNASSYVKAFSNGVQDLYNKLVEGIKVNEGTEDEKTLHAADKYLPENVALDDLIMTNYGYHILTSLGTTALTYSAKVNESSAKEFTVTWKGEEVKLLNQNDNMYPNQYQWEIYLAEIMKDGSTTLSSTIENTIKYTSTDFNTRFKSNLFQSLYFIYSNNMLNTIELSANDLAQLQAYFEYQKHSFDSYNDYSETGNNQFAGWWTLFGCE